MYLRRGRVIYFSAVMRYAEIVPKDKLYFYFILNHLKRTYAGQVMITAGL
jgi:hypothetical protein